MNACGRGGKRHTGLRNVQEMELGVRNGEGGAKDSTDVATLPDTVHREEKPMERISLEGNMKRTRVSG